MKQPPIARRDDAADPYAWLQNRDDPEVLAYLEAENAWLEDSLAGLADLREQLFQEIKGRIRETDLSLPRPRRGYLYYQRTQAGDEYARYYRCKQHGDSLQVDSASEVLLLDPNALAQGGFLSLGALTMSPDQSLLAYSLDQSGDEIYRLYIKELASGAVTELPFANADGSLVWANDNRTLFYVELDETHRPHRLYRFDLHDQQAQSVFHEQDGRYFLGCHRASSEQRLIILSASKTTSEAWILDADAPWEAPRCMAPRQDEHEYYPDHDGEHWLIRTNADGINFALYQAPDATPEREHWRCVRAHDPQVMLEDIDLTRHGRVLSLRVGGGQAIEVRPAEGAHYRVDFPDAVHSVSVQDPLEFASPVMRLRYESLNRPPQIRELRLADGQQKVLKETPVEGDFDADRYVTQRLWADVGDGVRVPISLIGTPSALQGDAPLYLYGYGAYGHSLDPWFSHARLSLLDRGVLFAIAHVRGGGEMGQAWYHQGRLEHKQNSFDDFIAVARHLIATGITEPRKLVISGGSAGGLLIGAVLNQAPDLFAGAVAEVPFVDTLNTMLDPDLPLTVTEYDEWGDPNDPRVYDRIKRYAPYENIQHARYPAILAVAGYHDSRVQYWEAAKWVARLRAEAGTRGPLLLKTEFSAGHGGMSGRYQALKDAALEYSFVLQTLGLA